MRELKKKPKRHICRICHKKSWFISNNGLCRKCMLEKIRSARFQMKTKEGPVYEKWKKNIVAGLDKL